MTLNDWLSEQEKICEAATAGPWGTHVSERNDYTFTPSVWAKRHPKQVDYLICNLHRKDDRPFFPPRGDENNQSSDAEFIANSRTALPQALQVIRELREALKSECACEYVDESDAICPCCYALKRADEIVKGSGE